MDCPHHVTQRGNGRQAVFFADRDRTLYPDTFFDYASREAIRRGYPLGGDAFLEPIGRLLGRDLRPRPPGRPPKDAAALLARTG